MATLKAQENPGGQSAVITVDSAVAGGITLTAKGVYSVDTGGRIPAIDGLSGASPREAWGAVIDRVRIGDVKYHANISSVEPLSDA
ncbi:hypothetical protein GAY28_04425 [Azospirillum brasilense]|nr:hypothetical protein [Azospirillum brasilense]